MRIQCSSRSIICCFTACVAVCLLFSVANQAEAQATYTVTGTANNFGDSTGFSPQVGLNETYAAIFEIDTSVSDSDASAGLGVYSGAIVSSSIEFSGGYSSQVDFTGGTVNVIQDNAGGGISLFDSSGSNGILLFSFNPLPSDALLTTPQEIDSLAGSLWSLQEPDGGIVSYADPLVTRSMVLAVTSASAVPEPSSMGLLGLGLVVTFLRRRKS